MLLYFSIRQCLDRKYSVKKKTNRVNFLVLLRLVVVLFTTIIKNLVNRIISNANVCMSKKTNK